MSIPEDSNRVSMSAACSRALGLPEIVAAILEQLHHNKSLFAALQVNRLWADEASRVLWRWNPPIQGLVQIDNVERRQYYANKISSLEIDHLCAGRPFSQILNTRFPHLTRFSTSHNPEIDYERCLDHFLQPSLKWFDCAEGRFGLKVLLWLAERCPDLRGLSIQWQWPQPRIHTCDLVRVLGLMPSLTHICLYGLALGDLELYSHLASRPNLQGSSMAGQILTEDVTMKILANVTNPFANLRLLDWPVRGKAFHCLSRHLAGLNILALDLIATPDDILFAISDCTNLAIIHVTFAADSHVPAEGLLAVARKCSHLRVFNLVSTEDVDGRSITDDIIRQVATYLPKMTCFTLRIQTNLTIDALLYLGDRCTKLTNLALEGDFSLEQLWRPNLTPLFPQVDCLELIIKTSEEILYERAVSILLQQCPQLRLPMEYHRHNHRTYVRSVNLKDLTHRLQDEFGRVDMLNR